MTTTGSAVVAGATPTPATSGASGDAAIADSATAICAPANALFLMSAMFAAREAPSVSSLTRLSRKGVTSRPRTPAPSASASAASIAPWTRAPSASAASGIGTPTSMPEARPSRRCAAATAAASAAESTRSGAAQPDAREKKAGNSSAPSARTATPCVSRYSSVRGMSRIDLTPALTTSTGVRPSSTRSALTSIDASPPRWTPPIPPVTKTPMPAACASSIVDDTVVPPCAPRATACARSAPRHRAPTAPRASPSWAKRSSSSSLSPQMQTPSSTAIVHGSAPASRTTASTPAAAPPRGFSGTACRAR